MASKRKCKFSIHQLVAFCKNFENISEDEYTPSSLQVNQEELERRWNNLVDSYEDYFIGDDKLQEEEKKDDISMRYEEACNFYRTMKAKILEHLTKGNAVTNKFKNRRSALKLPPVAIQSFEGGYSKWPIFRDMFLAVVGNDLSVDPAEKVYYLRSKLAGEAFNIIKDFDLVSDNFDLAWNTLKERFENKRLLVNDQMKKIYGIQSSQTETLKSIKSIQSTVNDCLSILKTYEVNISDDNPFLMHLVTLKLPEETLRAWEATIDNHRELPSWSQINKFLSSRVEFLETMTDLRKSSTKDHHVHKSQAFHAQTEPSKNSKFCKKCKQSHPLKWCKYFKSLTPNERIKYVYDNKYCLNCLSTTHYKPKCTSTNTCNICQKKHHTMLHLEKNASPKNNFKENSNQSQEVPSSSRSQNVNTQASHSESTEQQENVQALFTQQEAATILPTALVHIKHSGELFTIRALLDAGSEKTFISSRTQQKLALPVETHNFQIAGLGGTIVGSSKAKCKVTLKSRLSNFTISTEAIVVPKLSKLLPSQSFKIRNLEEIQRLNLADPYFFKPSAIDMIIGSDYLPFINLKGVKSNLLSSFEARESHFGWYISGPVPVNQINTFATTVSTSENFILHEQIKNFWEIEEVEKTISTSESDKFCEEFYQVSTRRQSEGRYIVRLPFKKEYPDDMFLGPSKNIAFAQYNRMEKTLNKNPTLKEKYQNVLQEYIKLGHMEPIMNLDSNDEKQFSCYLPHHGVYRPESKSTQVRVVFNASKKTKSGFSLNDVLYQGPALQKDLTQIIIAWRNYKYVFTGDIEKMYRQILVNSDDRPYQQILFQGEGERSVRSYQLKTVTFGMNCAPFLALRTLQRLSEDCKNVFPRASAVLKNEVYVDDILSGGHTIQEAQLNQIQLKKALHSAGFPLKKITANHKELLENLAREDLLDEDFLKFESSSTIKTLGIRWDARQDSFYYDVKPMQTAPFSTKRQILSVIAKLFDPLGWIGPIVVTAKLLMQELWQCKADWDEAVPLDILEKWNLFIKHLPRISALRIPRWINFAPQYQSQIHGFCDSSERAYCCAVFRRITWSDGQIFCNLLAAKTKVAPIKKLTIPKLELCGALLLAKLVRILRADDPLPQELFLWTDSSIVLGWLQKPPNILKTFVANRVTKIASIANHSHWRHVKSEDNPADLGSRGCYPQDLTEARLWWHGPSWLTQPKESWPEPRIFDPIDLETKRSTNFHVTAVGEDTRSVEEQKVTDILTNFSSFGRALRVISYIFRFIERVRRRSVSSQLGISSDEVRHTKNRLIAVSQQTYFPKDIECLQNNQALNRRSRLLTVSPFIDKNNILRVGGRLSNAGLTYDERHPVIIPETSRFAVLLVKFTHEILLHGEHHIMLRALRQSFYIPRIRNLIRKCVRECRPCTIYKHKFQNQMMAALPPERVNFSLPFTYTGVDFAGPFSLKSSNLRNAKIVKGYVAVFVCFSTKAVHLEVCTDLSTECFLACFDRFVGRRGLPKIMFSDNGRNFLGASLKLLKTHNSFLKAAEQSLINKYSTHGFTWSFIPPYAPHMGGLWEAAVRSMKSHLKKIANNLNFTYEEFATLIIRIEAVLNSRPLSPLTENPNELLPLTPGHFLRGAPLISPPENIEEHEIPHLTFLKRWERLKAVQHLFARRWKNEYIVELQRRFKWKKERDNIKENDFVIIKDDMLPPTEWRLGRVTNVIRGKDGLVRVAELKTQNGIITRPIVKLCLLPSSETQPKLC